jgi:hypothetical protein
MKFLRFCILILLSFPLLTGCLYPQDRLKQNQIPYDQDIAAVQASVDQYQDANDGLLPIKNRDMSTPIYQKYPIDFNKLAPQYMQEPPGSAFESGGVYIYVLVDVETDPTVKLLDLKLTEEVRDLKLRLDIYRQNNGYPPVKEMIGENLFTLDYEKLGIKEEPYVVSPFSGKNLPLIMDNQVEIYVDYRIDLYEALDNFDHAYKAGDDISDLLVDHSMFVPAHSFPYTIDSATGEPIFLLK